MAKRAMKKSESKVYKEQLLGLRARLRGAGDDSGRRVENETERERRRDFEAVEVARVLRCVRSRFDSDHINRIRVRVAELRRELGGCRDGTASSSAARGDEGRGRGQDQCSGEHGAGDVAWGPLPLLGGYKGAMNPSRIIATR